MTGRALKKAETIDGALAPALTAADQKILRAVPLECRGERGCFPASRGLDAWLIARAVREVDVAYVQATLRGLQDRRLVVPICYATQRKPQRWVRPRELGAESTTKEETP